jgi:hypothetical protein
MLNIYHIKLINYIVLKTSNRIKNNFKNYFLNFGIVLNKKIFQNYLINLSIIKLLFDSSSSRQNIVFCIINRIYNS